MVTGGPAGAVRARLDRLRRHVADLGLAAGLISRPEHVRYMTGGPTAGAAFLMITQKDAVLVAPETEEPSSVLPTLGIEERPYVAYRAGALVVGEEVAAELAGELVERMTPGGKLGIELHHLPISIALATAADRLVDLTPALRKWRSVKDAWEQEALRHSVRLLEGAFAAAALLVRPGVTDRAIDAAVGRALSLATTKPVVMASNVASGPPTAESDPHPTGRPLQEGDLVLLDLYPTLDGYVADLTRTFVVGEPTADQQRRADIVALVLQEIQALLRPGARASDLDRAARAMLREAAPDLPPMPHHTGHGIGLLAWEEPWIGGDSNSTLEPGNVVAIEPGLYLPGWGGIRFEGNYLITEAGCERLDTYPVGLTAGLSTTGAP